MYIKSYTVIIAAYSLWLGSTLRLPSDDGSLQPQHWSPLSKAFYRGDHQPLTPGVATDIPLDYDVASVNEIVAASEASKEQMNQARRQLHDEALAACNDPNVQILDHGGWCYNQTTANHIVAKNGTVDADFLLPHHHVLADEGFVSTLAEKVLLKEDGSCCHSLTDLGAGVGQFGHALKARLPNLEYNGFDGGGNVEEFTNNYVHFVDLTRPLASKRTDWVISSEVGEHLPHQFEAQMIANLHAHNCKGIILTWAVLRQPGTGHVNCHSNDYLINIFQKLGYTFNDGLTSALRASATKSWWLKRSTMAFDRNWWSKPATCD